MKIIKSIIVWVLGLFQKNKTPYDDKIDEYYEKIKEVDKELEKKYDDVDEALEEWKK